MRQRPSVQIQLPVLVRTLAGLQTSIISFFPILLPRGGANTKKTQIQHRRDASNHDQPQNDVTIIHFPQRERWFFGESKRYSGDTLETASCDSVCRYLIRPLELLFRPIRPFKPAFTEGNVSPSLLPNEGSGMRRCFPPPRLLSFLLSDSSSLIFVHRAAW